MWGEQAEHVAESLAQGHLVVVVGRTGTRVWTPTDGARAGEEQRSLEVVADHIALSLRWGHNSGDDGKRTGGVAPDFAGDEESPFQRPTDPQHLRGSVLDPAALLGLGVQMVIGSARSPARVGFEYLVRAMSPIKCAPRGGA